MAEKNKTASSLCIITQTVPCAVCCPVFLIHAPFHFSVFLLSSLTVLSRYLINFNYPDLNIQIGGKPTIRMSKNFIVILRPVGQWSSCLKLHNLATISMWLPNQSQSCLHHYYKFAGTHFNMWVERGTVRVKCLAQEYNTMFPARTWTQTARFRVQPTNHSAS